MAERVPAVGRAAGAVGWPEGEPAKEALQGAHGLTSTLSVNANSCTVGAWLCLDWLILDASYPSHSDGSIGSPDSTLHVQGVRTPQTGQRKIR